MWWNFVNTQIFIWKPRNCHWRRVHLRQKVRERVPKQYHTSKIRPTVTHTSYMPLHPDFDIIKSNLYFLKCVLTLAHFHDTKGVSGNQVLRSMWLGSFVDNLFGYSFLIVGFNVIFFHFLLCTVDCRYVLFCNYMSYVHTYIDVSFYEDSMIVRLQIGLLFNWCELS